MSQQAKLQPQTPNQMFVSILENVIEREDVDAVQGFCLDPSEHRLRYLLHRTDHNDHDDGPTLRSDIYHKLIIFVKARVGLKVQAHGNGEERSYMIDLKGCPYEFTLIFTSNQYGEGIIGLRKSPVES